MTWEIKKYKINVDFFAKVDYIRSTKTFKDVQVIQKRGVSSLGIDERYIHCLWR